MAGHAGAHEVRGEPLVVAQLFLDQQQLTAQRTRVVEVREPDQRALVRARPAHNAVGAARHDEVRALRELMPRAVDVEASVQAVRLAHAAGCHERQSTTSTSTRCPPRTAAAFTTVLSAATVRPPRPITLPASSSATFSSRTSVPSSSSNDSTLTSSGRSTSDRARYSRSSSIYSAASSAGSGVSARASTMSSGASAASGSAPAASGSATAAGACETPALPVEVPPARPFECALTSCFTVFVGCAPRETQCWKRSSSITIVEGSVWGL